MATPIVATKQEVPRPTPSRRVCVCVLGDTYLHCGDILSGSPKVCLWVQLLGFRSGVRGQVKERGYVYAGECVCVCDH